MVAKLLDLTVFASSSEATPLKAFIFCGHCLALCPKCEETECNADLF